LFEVEMARRPRKIAVIPLGKFEVHDAANTVSRAREHLANPHMRKALKAHAEGLNAALTGGLVPKKPRPTAAKKGTVW
jgi:hypothetical protein